MLLANHDLAKAFFEGIIKLTVTETPNTEVEDILNIVTFYNPAVTVASLTKDCLVFTFNNPNPKGKGIKVTSTEFKQRIDLEVVNAKASPSASCGCFSVSEYPSPLYRDAGGRIYNDKGEEVSNHVYELRRRKYIMADFKRLMPKMYTMVQIKNKRIKQLRSTGFVRLQECVLPTEPFLLGTIHPIVSAKNIPKVHSIHDFGTAALLEYYSYGDKHYEIVACQEEPIEQPTEEPKEVQDV
jgi:hypothetical protein